MGVLQTTVTAVLITVTAASAAGQCVSEARVISTRQSAPNLVAGPAAFGNGVLAVAKFDRSDRRIFLGTYDENFNQLTGDTLIADDTPDGALALVWNGQGFGLFYRTERSAELVLQRLTASGQPIGGPIPVSSRTIDITEEVDVVWSSVLNAYVVATTYSPRANKDIWIAVIDRDGIVQRDLNTAVFALAEAAWLQVAVTNDGTIGVFYTAADESIVFARIGPTGGAPVDHVWTPGRDLQVVAIGNRFYLVKQVQLTDRSEIRWLILDSNGIVVGPDRLLVTAAGTDVRPLALVAAGQELALSYLDFDRNFPDFPPLFHLRRFTTTGVVIADSVFALADPVQAFAVSEHEFVWTGSSYVSTAVYTSGRELNSLLLRACPLRARVTTPREIVTNDEFVTFTAGAEGGAPGYSYKWNTGDSSATYTGQQLRYRFLHPGTYTVTLTVTDQAGVTTTATYTIRVAERKKRAVRK
jgi:PKD domain